MNGRTRYRFINFRSFLVLCLTLIAAVFLAVVSCAYRAAAGFTLCAAAVCALIAAAFLLRKRTRFIPVTFALSAVCTVIAFSSACATLFTWNPNIDYSAPHEVTAVVGGATVGDGGELRLTLDNLVIDGVKTKGALLSYVYEHRGTALEFVRPGDEIVYRGTLERAELVNGLKVNASYYRSGIRFTADLSAANASLRFGEPSVIRRARLDLYEALTSQLGRDYGDIAYGMLTGDKYALSADIRENFSIAGIGHILAVSGLHVGFLCGLMLVILKKARPRVKVGVTAGVLVAYMTFTGFSPSVVRAVIMCAVGLATLIGGGRKDGLNTLFFAMSVILLISPLVLFDLGFQMSCGSVFGLLLFTDGFTGALRRIKIPRFIAAPLSVSAAAQLGLTPVALFYFNYLSGWSVLVNLLMIPVMSAAFILLFILSLFVLLIPPAAVLYRAAGILLWTMDAVAEGVTFLPFASIVLYVGWYIWLCYPLFFAASRYLMLPRAKGIVSAVCALAVAAAAVAPNCSFPYKQAIIPVLHRYNVSSVVTTRSEIVWVGDFGTVRDMRETMRVWRIRRLDEVYLTGLDEITARTLGRFAKRFHVKTVYVPIVDLPGLQTLAATGVNIVMLDAGEGNTLTAVYTDGNFLGYELDFGKGKAMFVRRGRSFSELPADRRQGCAVVRQGQSGESDRIYFTNYPDEDVRAPTYRADYVPFAFFYNEGAFADPG